MIQIVAGEVGGQEPSFARSRCCRSPPAARALRRRGRLSDYHQPTMRPPALRALLIAVVVSLAGCTVATVETPDPKVIPSGALVPQGEEPTGEVVELGGAQALDIGWRYAIYPSADGWCTQLETTVLTSAACGDPLPKGDAAFGGVSAGQLEPNGIRTFDGLVTSETATVWLIGEGGLRAPATLMSAEPAGLDALAFVGFAPADVTVTHLQAVAMNGDVLETYEVP